MRTEKVFLYGHYDSRGGTTSIASSSRATADWAYALSFTGASEKDASEQDRELARECLSNGIANEEGDFLGMANLIVDREITNGEDIDDAYGVWVEVPNEYAGKASECIPRISGNRLAMGSVRELSQEERDQQGQAVEYLRPPIAPRRGFKWVHPQWDDDAFQMIYLEAK